MPAYYPPSIALFADTVLPEDPVLLGALFGDAGADYMEIAERGGGIPGHAVLVRAEPPE